jgi:hypothetical protein
MKSKRTTALWTAVVLVVVALWWFIIVDYFIARPNHKPNYHLPILLLVIVLVTCAWHVRALYRFHKMTKAISQEEILGDAPPGSTVFAANQRFRYFMRTIESMVVLVVSIIIFVAVSSPSIAVNHQYSRLVITYFVGSILITGYLTFRDLRVVNHVKKTNEASEDETILVPGRKKK